MWYQQSPVMGKRTQEVTGRPLTGEPRPVSCLEALSLQHQLNECVAEAQSMS